MKKLLIFSCLIFGIVSIISAQKESSLLWKISGHELSEPSYIYGTIHIICPQDYQMRQEVKSTFSKSKQVYLEIDFDDPQMMQKMMGLMVMNNGKTAEDYLTEEEYMILDNTFKQKLGAGMDQLKTMKPLMLLSMSYISVLSCQPQSFEKVFVEMASAEGKEVKGLETIEYQMDIFDQIPLEKQYSMIVDIVKKEDAAKEDFKEMVKIYNKEDINALLKLLDSSEWNYEGFEDVLVNNRNKDWADKFADIAKRQSTFFAVGAAHLAGDQGLLNLLKEKGYKVEAVMPSRK